MPSMTSKMNLDAAIRELGPRFSSRRDLAVAEELVRHRSEPGTSLSPDSRNRLAQAGENPEQLRTLLQDVRTQLAPHQARIDGILASHGLTDKSPLPPRVAHEIEGLGSQSGSRSYQQYGDLTKLASIIEDRLTDTSGDGAVSRVSVAPVKDHASEPNSLSFPTSRR